MGIKDLPKSGTKFSVNDPYGGFKKKLKSVTRYGELKNLQDNLDAILKVVKQYERYIKRGELDYKKKYKMKAQIRKLDKNITKEDIREIDKIIEHLDS